MTMTPTVTGALPPVVVDRSPELFRAPGMAGAIHHPHRFILDATDGDVRGDGSACAVARLCISLPGVKEAHLEGENPYVVYDDGMTGRILLDGNIIGWIGRFDRGEPVEPLEIQLGF